MKRTREIAVAELEAHLGLAKHALAEGDWCLGQLRAKPGPHPLAAAQKWARAARTNLMIAQMQLRRLQAGGGR